MHKQMTMPLFFGLLFIGVILLYGTGLLLAPLPMAIKIVAGLSLPFLAGAMVWVLRERNTEIQKEEQDDLGNY